MTDDSWSQYLDWLSGQEPAEADGFPYESWKRLSASGLFEELGDLEVDPTLALRRAVSRIRELGRAGQDRGLTFSAVTQLASTLFCLRTFAPPDLRDAYLPPAAQGQAIGGHAITEAEAGSDVMAMSTTAHLTGEHYVLRGTKRFITNAPVAATLVVYARTIEDGVDRGLSAFLVETGWRGVDVGTTMPTAGLRTSPIGEVVLDDVRVPATHRVGHTGAGLLVLDQVMKREILLAFAANLGEMERLVASSVRHVNQRRQFGVSIGSNQLVANRVVETQIAVELGGALIDSIVDRLDGYDDLTVAVAAAKIFISEANVTAALNALQVHGGAGYLVGSPLPVALLDAVPGAIYSGSNDVLRTKIATLIGVAS